MAKKDLHKGLNLDGCSLGSLCKKGHDWQGTSKSLRYKSSGACVICTRDRSVSFGKTRTHVYIASDLYERVSKAASNEGVSIASWIDTALNERLEGTET